MLLVNTNLISFFKSGKEDCIKSPIQIEEHTFQHSYWAEKKQFESSLWREAHFSYLGWSFHLLNANRWIIDISFWIFSNTSPPLQPTKHTLLYQKCVYISTIDLHSPHPNISHLPSMCCGMSFRPFKQKVVFMMWFEHVVQHF